MATSTSIKSNIRARLAAYMIAHPSATGIALNHVDIAVEELYDSTYRDDRVKARIDPSSGIPASPALYDSYIATASANGWIANHVYEWSGIEWVDKSLQEGMLIWVDNEDLFLQYNGSTFSALTATGAVNSVNGKTGTVVLTNSDVGAAPTSHSHSEIIAPNSTSKISVDNDNRIVIGTLQEGSIGIFASGSLFSIQRYESGNWVDKIPYGLE